ncbi:MAG TPA: PorV/PorQ family protein [Candidatus Latescibacteria bacterium]|nr:PorV/PorQ family protein [Candidatus Latescibacterota bacterium]
MRRWILVGALSVLLGTSHSHATNESQAAALFLLIEPGAWVGAMGGSFVTLSQDVLCTYYNPAGLAGQRDKQLTFMHTDWLPALVSDMYYEYFGYSQYLKGWGNVGVAFTFLDMGKQIYTTEYGTEQGTFHSYDAALSFSYGTYMSRRLALGVTLKFVYSHLAETGAGHERGKGIGSSVAMDLGLLYYTSVPGLRVGAALKNVGPKISYIDVAQADPLPTYFAVGASWKVLDTEYNDVVIVLDLYKPLVRRKGSRLQALLSAWTDEGLKEELEQVDLHLGVEYTYSSFLALRAGYSYDKDGELKTPTFGFGLRYNWIQMDYAYLPARNTALEDNQRFSVTLRW